MTGATPRHLRMLYRQIPAPSACKLGCSDCCGPVPWSKEELAGVQADIPITARWIRVRSAEALQDSRTGMCPFASTAGCKVYNRRPFMCRLFASTKEATQISCPHGCRPAVPLSEKQAHALATKYINQTEPAGAS